MSYKKDAHIFLLNTECSSLKPAITVLEIKHFKSTSHLTKWLGYLILDYYEPLEH